MKRKELGDWGEEKAVKYLQEKKYEILERNYRTRLGEIDLVARDGSFLVFIEVKTRSSQQFGSPQAAVNYIKQQRIRKIADYYLLEHPFPEGSGIRFDVIAINRKDGKGIMEHLINAF